MIYPEHIQSLHHTQSMPTKYIIVIILMVKIHNLIFLIASFDKIEAHDTDNDKKYKIHAVFFMEFSCKIPGISNESEL